MNFKYWKHRDVIQHPLPSVEDAVLRIKRRDGGGHSRIEVLACRPGCVGFLHDFLLNPADVTPKRPNAALDFTERKLAAEFPSAQFGCHGFGRVLFLNDADRVKLELMADRD